MRRRLGGLDLSQGISQSRVLSTPLYAEREDRFSTHLRNLARRGDERGLGTARNPRYSLLLASRSSEWGKHSKEKTMRRILVAVVVVAFLSLPAVSLAEAPSYTYIEGGFIDVSIDKGNSFDFDDDGFFVGGSYGGKHFHAFAEFQEIGDFDSWNVGGGWQGLLGEKADLVAQITFQNIEVDLGGFPGIADVDDNGTVVSVGVRWQLLKILEINGFISAPDFDDIEDDFVLDVNAILTFGKFGIGAGWESSDEDRDTARVYARWMFGR